MTSNLLLLKVNFAAILMTISTNCLQFIASTVKAILNSSQMPDSENILVERRGRLVLPNPPCGLLIAPPTQGKN